VRLALLALILGAPALAAEPAAVVGTWRGESLCTVKPSACHDEVVVYHFAPGKTPAAIVATANKIVDGKEVPMGVLDCTFDAARRALVCPIPLGTFRFAIEGRRLSGTLELRDGTLFRRISATKSD
jgi:hypothetical protein